MGLLDKLGFSEKEIKLVKKTAVLSTTLCILTVVGVWITRFSILQYQNTHRSASEESTHSNEPPDLSAFYQSKAEQILPIDITAHKLCLEYYMKIDDPQKAIEHIQRILPLTPTDRKLNSTLATAYLRAGHYSRAEEEFKKLEETGVVDSLSPSIDALYGLTLYYAGKIEESRNLLSQALIKNPSSAEAACFLGQVEAAIATPSPAAESLFQRATTNDPGYVETWYQWGRYQLALGNYTSARTMFIEVLNREPLNSRAHARLGMTYYYLNEPQLSKKSYEIALALNPEDYNTRYNFGELLYSSFQDNAAALEEFKRTIELQPDHGEAHFKIGLICMENDMFKEAVQHFERASELMPNSVRILLQLATAYERLTLKENAIAIYEQILTQDALNLVAHQKIELLTRS